MGWTVSSYSTRGGTSAKTMAVHLLAMRASDVRDGQVAVSTLNSGCSAIGCSLSVTFG